MNKLNLRKIYVVLVLLLCCSGAAFAQGYNTTNWKFSNPKQFGFNLTDVDYFDDNNVIAVGDNGGIAKSTDGGKNWTYGCFTYLNLAGLKAKGNFTDVHFITSTVAYAVGAGGLMIKTTDAGVTWNVVTTPLWANAKNINTCWFLDANKGYIGGAYNNTLDSLPKLYFTLNGGSTWDSIAAPAANCVSRCGYINNPNVPSVLVPVDSKFKEIYRIEFINNNLGYISGSSTSLFPRVSVNAVAATCAASTGSLTSSAFAAPLLWKFSNGVLTDYSITKEKLGYFGINTNTVTCTTGYANITPVTQVYKAINIVNDTTVVMMSFNNSMVLRVHTGVNDSTLNVNAAGVYEKGKYELLNWQSPPTQGPNASGPIPAVQVLLASNPLNIRRAASGKLIAGSTNSTFAGTPGYLWTSVDTGRTWKQEVPYPQTPNIIANFPGAQVVDLAPNGRVLVMGQLGSVTDSLPGGNWQTNWSSVPVSAGYNDIEFVDCNNGIAAGSASITVTTDGGNTWIDRFSPVLQSLNAQIGSVSYVSLTKAYFPTSIGNIYRTANQAQNLSPVFAEPTARLNDMATVGPDSLWACGDLFNSPLPTAQRSGVLYRSFNNAVTWDTVRVGPIGSATFITWKGIEFPSRAVGYMCGNRGSVYKTIDGGATWTDISPFPALTPVLSYTDIQALDVNTVVVVGNGFPRKAVYKTIDGGATWTDITGNILTTGAGNLNGVLMHDANNGYVMSPGAILVTNNGGTSWTYDAAPSSCIFTPAAFVPKTVGPGVSMINRKMFVSGVNVSGAPMMEYGNPANTTVNSLEAITGVTCSSPNTGSIVITASGGLAPYTYSINGGAYGNSNTFSGLTQGNYIISIKDAYCGILTKTVTVGLTDNLVLNTNITSATICQGQSVQLTASGNAATYSWSPALGLSNPNIANPVATPASTTTYTVTATLNSCVKTANITINVTPNPQITIAADPGTTLCEGDPTKLTVMAGAVQATGTFVWTPALGLSATNTNPVAASPMVTTTYSVTATNLSGCTSSTNITITVNQRPKVLTQPVNVTVCSATSTNFSITASGTGITYQWQESTTGAAGPWNNLTNVAPYSNVTTATLTINPATFAMNGYRYRCVVSGTCPAGLGSPNISNGAVLSVNALPAVAVTPNNQCAPVTLTATGANTYTWSPATGLNVTTGAVVIANPSVNTTYTVTGTNTATGCVATATATVNYTPAAPTVNPTSAAMCLGDAAVPLTITSSLAPTTLSFTNNTPLNIPDGPASWPQVSFPGVASTLPVAGIPAGAVISKMNVTLNITHTYVSDLVIVLKAPNGNVLNLDANISMTGPAGANAVSTVISSAGVNALSTSTAPYTGTFKPDAVGATYTINFPPAITFPGGPTSPAGYIPTVNNFSGLYSTPNGNWSIGVYDWGAGDVGTITSWTLDITYGLPSVGIWTPNGTAAAGLYTDAAATILYTGTPAQTVYAKPATSTTYSVVVNTGQCNSLPTQVPVTVNVPVAISNLSANATVCADKVAVFSVTVSGTSPSYQWQVSTNGGATYSNVTNGSVYSGATSATLTITAPPVSYNGNLYRVIVNGSAPCGNATSASRTLTVNPLPAVAITAAPYRNLLPGLTTTLTATSTPAAATYTWFRNNAVVATATTGSLVVDIDHLGDYKVVVADVNGCVGTSNTININDSVSGRVFIYPNPNNGQFQVRYNPVHNRITPYGINIMDALGKRVTSLTYPLGTAYAPMYVNLSNHATGVYWVEVVDVDGNRLAMGRVEILR